MGETTNVGDTGATGDGASKTPLPQSAGNTSPSSAPEEPRILEEHIVAPPPIPAPAPQKAPAPARTPIQAPFVPPAPPTLVSIPTPPPTPISVIPPSLKPDKPEPVVHDAANAFDAKVEKDMAQILQGVKLPERHTAVVSPTPPKQVYDTSLATDPEKKAQADAARMQALQDAQAAARAITESLPNTASKPQDDVRRLHTLRDDLQNVVRDKKISLVRAVALEEEKRHHGSATEEHTEVQVHRQKRARFGFFLVGLLILVGLIAIGSVLFIMYERTNGIAAPIAAQLLFAEQSVPYQIDAKAPADIRREIAFARNSGTLTLGAILQIVPVETQTDASGQKVTVPLSFSQFLDAIGARAPQELSRALSDTFFFGIHTVDENAPLLVIPVTSYERAFAAMLDWEKTMNNDLSPIFTSVPMRMTGPDGVPKERFFEDTVMRNYDVRALKDDSGTVQLYYSFPTRDILIIAESPYSFSEILSRLKADKKL